MQNNKGNALYIERDTMIKTRYVCCEKGYSSQNL